MEDVKKDQREKNIGNAGNTNEEEMKMDELLGPDLKIEEGKIIKVRVIGEIEDGYLVDLGMKSEGLIPRSEFDLPELSSEIKVSAEISVMVVQLHSETGHPIVSYKKIKEKDTWDRILKAQAGDGRIEGTIIRKVKGGLMVYIGIEAFLPMSQIELHFVKDVDKYIGKKLVFLITETSRENNKVVLSRRRLLEIEQKLCREETLSRIKEGSIVEGRVTNITNFGAFVDIGGMEGLLHISDITWQRLDKVGNVLKVDQKVKVQVLRIDRQKEKISLGMKQITPRPWDSAAQKYPEGTVVKGKVTSITDFGVFVEIEPSIEGLMHISEIFWDGRKSDLKKNFAPGQELEVRVISINSKEEKMSLSLKRMQVNPWEEAQSRYTPNTRVKGVVTHLAPFGAFVKLPEGIEGLIHVSDMSWVKKVRQPQDVVKVGQEVEAVVLEVNTKTEKISLSIKHLGDDPFSKYRTGQVISGIIKHITDFGAFIQLEPGLEALVRSSEIAAKKVESPADVLKVGQNIDAKVIKSDPRERKIEISIKRLEQDKERELLRKYVNNVKNPTLGEVLEEE